MTYTMFQLNCINALKLNPSKFIIVCKDSLLIMRKDKSQMVKDLLKILKK